MLGRVGRIAPGVELLPARALAADPVRPGAAQPRVLDRLVRVDGDMILRRALHHVEMMAHRILAREPLRHAVAVDDRAARANIAGLEPPPALIGIDFRATTNTQRHIRTENRKE